MKNVTRFSYHRFLCIFSNCVCSNVLYTLYVLNIFKRVCIFPNVFLFGNKRFSSFPSHVYSRSALTRIGTCTQNRLQRYKKKMNYANILAKKCQKNAASTNLGRFPIPASTILARFSPPASTNLGRFPIPASTNLGRYITTKKTLR